MGETWVKISPDLTTNDPAKQKQEDSGGLSRDNSGAENHCTIFTIAESPLDENIVWAGTDDGNVQLTQDGGKTWKNVVANIPGLPKNTMTYHIEASVFGKGIAYAVFTGYQTGDMATYVYKTTDFGTTWKSIVTPDIYGFARNIQEDYENQNLLFLGTEFGLFITLNGGQSWNKFTNNMPAANVHFMELHKRTNDLVVATHGRGIIIIDDISPLRQLTEENLNKELHFFTTKPTVMDESNGFSNTAGETQFVGGNAPASAQIKYYLKKRHTLGKMTMEIQDASGNRVTELSPGKAKGINIVNWNYVSKTPKTAKAKTAMFQIAFAARRVPAGKYNVVIQKGKETYTHTIELQYDQRTGISLDDRKAQEATTQKLFDMNEQLAYLVYELDETLSASEKLKEKVPSTSKTVTPFITELTRLKERLVITKGDNYVGMGEPQLREKMGELYAKVSQTFYRPNAAEMANLEALESSFQTAKDDFKRIKDKHLAKVNALIQKNGTPAITLLPFDEFVKQP
jgi:hypothetical protein